MDERSRSLDDHPEGLADDVRKVGATGHPLFLTEQGKTTTVVLSRKVYDELVDKAELAENLASIDRSLVDINAGRVMDSREVKQWVAKKCGLTLEG